MSYHSPADVRKALPMKSFTALSLVLLMAVGCSTIDNQSTDRDSENRYTVNLPETISPEARAFLTRTKGDIISNYIRDEAGNYVLSDIYRKAAPDMELEETELNGVKAFWFSSAKASGTNVVVVYFHGGGYVKGSGNEGGGIVFPVYEETGVRGLSVDYRLAPEHPFPAAVEDAKNVFLGLLAEGYRPDQIALTGDSAGGGLALAATLALKEEGKPLPGAIVVISPGVVDMKVFGDTYTTLADWDPFEKPSDIYPNIDKYAGKTRRDHPLMSPLYGNYEGFPPFLIQVGTRDLLLSDSVRLARKARKAGVDVTLDVWEGMWHSWHMSWPEVPEAREACHDIAVFLKKHLRY
jgi:acetyl esterase/lipase